MSILTIFNHTNDNYFMAHRWTYLDDTLKQLIVQKVKRFMLHIASIYNVKMTSRKYFADGLTVSDM